MPRIDDSALKSLELSERAAPMPVKRVDRLISQLESWSDEWIGADHGKIGYWEREGLFQRRLSQIKRTFKRNILICNPNLKDTDDQVPEDHSTRSNGCRSGDNDSKACSIFEVSRLKRVKNVRNNNGCIERSKSDEAHNHFFLGIFVYSRIRASPT